MTTEISNTDDILDVRDVIERYEALEELETVERGEDEKQELASLEEFLDDLKGNGGNHQWRGDWYPVTLIHENHFRDYAEELAEDIGAINKDAGWPNSFIDWDAAAEALKQDYYEADFDGQTYYCQ